MEYCASFIFTGTFTGTASSGFCNSLRLSSLKLEARVGIEPTHKAFAEPCLTTWLPRHSAALRTLNQFAGHASLYFFELENFPLDLNCHGKEPHAENHVAENHVAENYAAENYVAKNYVAKNYVMPSAERHSSSSTEQFPTPTCFGFCSAAFLFRGALS